MLSSPNRWGFGLARLMNNTSLPGLTGVESLSVAWSGHLTAE
ncbi:hypothetical protein ACNKHK_03790 [Shigella flexneri]